MTYKYFILARHFIIIILMFLSGSIMATMDTVSVTTDTGAAGSLRQIVTHATTGDTIVFSSMIDGDSIQLTSGQITIDKDLVIIGNGTTNTIIDGSMDNNSRLFKLTNAAEVKMSHLTIQNGGGPEASLLGGAILIESSADLILYNCVLQHNKSNGQDSGGAIAVLNGTCTSINCIFDGNQSLNNSGFSRGGAVLVAGSGQYDAVNCLFVNNTSANNGAVLTNNSGIVTITNCTLTDNTSTSNSVLYHQSGATTTLNNNIIHTNNGSLPISGTSTLIASNNLIDSAGLISNGTNGNFIGAPMFIDTLSGNYRLKSTSPANNAGINDSIPTGTLTDLDGNPRIRQDTVDIGAYEGISCTVPDTLYVNIDNTSPTAPADGSSWSSALTDLQEAINISNACGGGKQIWVAEGTYRPTQAFDLDEQNGAEQRERTFYITQPVQIYGGFTPGATMLSQRDFMNRNTILTADLGNNQDTAYHIMFMTADSITSDWVIDGLKIQDGRAQGTSDNNMNGGGIYAVGVNTTSPCIDELYFYKQFCEWSLRRRSILC